MEISPVLTASPLFRHISETELPALLTGLKARTAAFQRGELLLRRGEDTGRMGLLLAGTVHIIREDFWGRRSIVGLVGPGEIFGESYALAGVPPEVSVLAATRGEALSLDAAELTAQGGQLAANLTLLLAEKNLQLTRKIRHMARRTTRDKLMSYLSAQALLAGSPSFDIPMDRQQLADYLAVDRSAMSTELGKLRDEGVLEVRKNHFRLLNQAEGDE